MVRGRQFTPTDERIVVDGVPSRRRFLFYKCGLQVIEIETLNAKNEVICAENGYLVLAEGKKCYENEIIHATDSEGTTGSHQPSSTDSPTSSQMDYPTSTHTSSAEPSAGFSTNSQTSSPTAYSTSSHT
jgi:hypothetical protein